MGTLERTPRPVFETYAAVLQRQMDLVDPPRHTQLRRVFGKAFATAQLERLRVFTERWVETRLSSLPPSFDVLDEIARPLPFALVMELLGVPSEWRPTFDRNIEAFVAGLSDPVSKHPEVATALVSLRDLLSAALARPELGEGSLLSIARDAIPEALSLDDLVANVILTVAAGHHTTTNLIGNGAWLLLTHHDQRTRIAAQPHLWATAIEEMLRFESPIQTVRRVCTEAMQLDRQQLNASDELILMLGAANRDRDEFERADHFDITRTPNRHVAFGGGAHACLGAPLARLQARAALGGLFALPALRAVDAEPAWASSTAFRGLERLIVERS